MDFISGNTALIGRASSVYAPLCAAYGTADRENLRLAGGSAYRYQP